VPYRRWKGLTCSLRPECIQAGDDPEGRRYLFKSCGREELKARGDYSTEEKIYSDNLIE